MARADTGLSRFAGPGEQHASHPRHFVLVKCINRLLPRSPHCVVAVSCSEHAIPTICPLDGPSLLGVDGCMALYVALLFKCYVYVCLFHQSKESYPLLHEYLSSSSWHHSFHRAPLLIDCLGPGYWFHTPGCIARWAFQQMRPLIGGQWSPAD